MQQEKVSLVSATSDLDERVVSIRRVTKVVKGGRRFSFSALVVVGTHDGAVGFGSGKSAEVPEAISKATRSAKKNAFRVKLKDGSIPHEVIGHYGSSKIIMRPASSGTGVIAGGAARALLEAVGVKDILTKCVGSRNPYNVIRATLQALGQLS
jgi:small subunit ribosomal protein S5